MTEKGIKTKGFTLYSEKVEKYPFSIIAQIDEKEKIVGYGTFHYNKKNKYENGRPRTKANNKKTVIEKVFSIEKWKIAIQIRVNGNGKILKSGFHTVSPDKGLLYSQKYRKTNNGRKNMKRISLKQNHKRRLLGFLPLNTPFPGSNGHHVNRDVVIYIPGELHRSVPHNVRTGKGMDEINHLAFEWLGEK